MGTAQFGLDYGISNASGAIPITEIQDILSLARDKGVLWLDTAADYGVCEEKLYACSDLLPDFKIGTKLPKYNPETFLTFESVTQNYEKHLAQSCAYLHRQTAELCYLRSPEILFEQYGVRVSDWLIYLKEQKYIRKIGVSVYDEAQIKSILRYFEPDVIQIPCSILDQRLIHSDILQNLKSRNVEIYARSIFLQGLIFMNPQSLPSYFRPLQKELSSIRSMLHKYNVSPLHASLAFILSQDMIDRVIVGVSKLEEWQDILNIVDQCKDAHHDINWEMFQIRNVEYLNPTNWKV